MRVALVADRRLRRPGWGALLFGLYAWGEGRGYSGSFAQFSARLAAEQSHQRYNSQSQFPPIVVAARADLIVCRLPGPTPTPSCWQSAGQTARSSFSPGLVGCDDRHTFTDVSQPPSNRASGNLCALTLWALAVEVFARRSFIAEKLKISHLNTYFQTRFRKVTCLVVFNLFEPLGTHLSPNVCWSSSICSHGLQNGVRKSRGPCNVFALRPSAHRGL